MAEPGIRGDDLTARTEAKHGMNATRKPVKIIGNAPGSSTRRSICKREAPNDIAAVRN